MGKALPLIWVLCGARAGDTAQALELARQVGGQVVEKKLAFNVLHALPNVLKPVGLQSLSAVARDTIFAPWPDLVIATGKRTAPIACAIKALSGGHAKIVQLGRPRMALHHFDLVITTPQYGLPEAANVIALPTPFAVPKVADVEVNAHWTKTWEALPKPWIMAAIGASKYPLRLGQNELEAFASALDRAAKPLGASILLFDSPRSADGARQSVTRRLQSLHWSAPSGPGAYQSALASAEYFAVTGDSVSMLSEMLATGKPTAVFPLPLAPRISWSAAKGVGAVLARRGLLSPPRDVAGFVTELITSGRVGTLGETWGQAGFDTRQHDDAVQRVRRLVGLP